MAEGGRRGRRVTVWLPVEEADELERLRDELATSTGRATLARAVRTALDALSLEISERSAAPRDRERSS